jgi:moderate conductance mechanosensitive channel
MARDRLPKFVIALIFLAIIWQLVRFFVGRMNAAAAKRRDLGHAAQLRTMATIFRATSYSVIGFVGFLQFLRLLNYDPTPLLASAGILAVGIGLGAQSLFKDIINGIFILIEDQYNVGEIVKIASLQGTVEDLTLRLTRLRDRDGTLYIIPNSQIATVSNLSRDYSVATLPIVVDASANPDTVIAVLEEIAAQLSADEAFKGVFIDSPQVLGVDRIDGRSIVYPVNFRVGPNQKDAVLRDLRKRIVLTFEAKGIPLGIDASMLIMQQPKADPTAPPAQNPLTGS